MKKTCLCPVLGLAALILAVPGRSQAPSAPGLAIVAYDIRLEPDFSRNTVTCDVRARVRNLSPGPAGSVDIRLCFGADDGTYDHEMEAVSAEDGGVERPLEFTRGTPAAGGRPQDPYSYRVRLRTSLAPGGDVRLRFRYLLKSRPGGGTFPIFENKGGAKELYLITDYEWLPRISYEPAPNVFADIYRSSWSLRVSYPSSYASAVDGERIGEREAGGVRTEEWRSVTGGVPQVFIGRYHRLTEQRSRLTLEMFIPPDDALKANAAAVGRDIFEILDLFIRLFGAPGGSTFRLVGSATPNGAHGLHMGLVAQSSYLRTVDLETMAHEVSHTWWGSSLSSYGEGSKFLRESLAGFSSAWALKEIRGPAAFRNAMLKFKAEAFFPYPARREEAKRYPVIEQPGYESRGIVRACYSKGPLILDELRRELGDSVFFAGLGAFARNFKDRNVTMADLVRTFDETSGRSLEARFKELCWTAGAASYALEGFASTRSGDGYVTEVRVRNDGDMAAGCPVLLGTRAGEVREGFSCAPRSGTKLRYETPQEAVRVVLDPDLEAFQYRPEQKYAVWAKLDEASFAGANWSWFNKSYACFRLGKPAEAVRIITAYLDQVMKARAVADVRDLGRDPLHAAYLFSRGLYRYAGKETGPAEEDVRAAIPGLLRVLSDKRLFPILDYAGIVGAKDPDRELGSLLRALTGKEPAPGPGTSDEAREASVRSWAAWWESQGHRGPLDLKALDRYVPTKTN